MSLAISAPLVGLAATGIKSAADFEQSMNQIQAAGNLSAETMAAMQAQALQLGAETSFSAGEAADAMLEMTKAGFDAEQTMAAIPGVMSLAAAGEMELADAGNLVIATLNTFGMAAEDSQQVADQLAAGANASTASMTDLAQGLAQAGFAADAMNQDSDDLITALSLLTDVGLTGSDGATAYKNALMRMMAPTAQAKEAMNALGISFF